MESHYKDSLSTAIVNILLQCGFENSSKRALDELVGMSLNYIKNITSKISNLTNECNLPESDILIGLGALSMHGHELDDLFSFVQNYNDIFPPPPKTYFGPIPLKCVESKTREEKPIEIVSWAPDMSPSLATIGMKLKNRQIVSDPNFDRSNYLALSLNSPPLKNTENKNNGQSKSFSSNSNNKIQKYGSNCSYHLPPEAYPNKYEPPTIDLDSNGAVIGLNGKIGKLPDPFISDIEEQDLLRQKSKFLDIQQSKLSFSNHQLFNGVRQKKFSKIQDDNFKRLTPNRNLIESNHDEMKENISKYVSPIPYMKEINYKSNQIERNAISDDAWKAALQATVEPHVKPEITLTNFNNHDSPAQSETPTNKKSKKHKRTSSFTNSRPKKTRKVEVEGKIFENASQVYQNESTMDSYVSERSVPYSSLSDREPMYNHYDTYHSNHLPDKSPSYSPANNFVPTNSIYYQTEIVPPPVSQSTTKSFKSKKKSRKTHYTNKKKKKPFNSSTTVNNTNNFYSNNHQLESHPSRLDLNDNASMSQRSLSIHYDRSNTTSPHPPMDTYFDDSDDDRTEPMQESSEELIKMLEMTDGGGGGSSLNQKSSNSINVVESPPLQEILNNDDSMHMHSAAPSQGSIRMKIKIKKNKNSITRGPSSIVNSNTDLSSPIQSQHSDDKNSISERLQLMHYMSPSSELEGPCHYNKSPNQSHYDIQQASPAYSSTQESFRDCYRPDDSVASGGALSPMFSKPPTPNKLIIKPSFNINRFNSSSTHSSPKTLPALDDCDKIPTLLFKTSKSIKKRKRTRLSSGSKKLKSKKSVKLKPNHEEFLQKPNEKPFVSVDDVFSDEDDNIKLDLNHLNTIDINTTTTTTTQSPFSQRPMQQLPVILDRSPYRVPIPPIKISSKSSLKKPSKVKAKPIVMNTPPAKVEPKLVYNYCCLQGEAYYKSEDGKTVYTCPICNTEDNGSLMLGCDRCEDWYHGLCLGIFIPPPEDQDWFCPRCNEDKLSESLNLSATKSKSKSRTKKK